MWYCGTTPCSDKRMLFSFQSESLEKSAKFGVSSKLQTTPLHNVQIIKKKKKDIHADVLLSWLQNSTFNSYLLSTLLFVLLLVRKYFHLLRTSRRIMRLCRRFPELTDFLDYFQRNYLNANGSFPPQMWNVLGRTMDNRTNNNVENKYELKVPFCNQLNKTSAWIFFFFFIIIW
jgi:hypothetical protein